MRFYVVEAKFPKRVEGIDDPRIVPPPRDPRLQLRASPPMSTPDRQDEELAHLLLEVEVVVRAPQQEPPNALRGSLVAGTERWRLFEDRDGVPQFPFKEVGRTGTVRPPPSVDLPNLRSGLLRELDPQRAVARAR